VTWSTQGSIRSSIELRNLIDTQVFGINSAERPKFHRL